MASIWLTWKLLGFEEHHQESKNQPRKQEKIQIIYDKAQVSRIYKMNNTNNRGTNCSNKNFYEEAHDTMTNINSNQRPLYVHYMSQNQDVWYMLVRMQRDQSP